jgi:hypothetical protein
MKIIKLTQDKETIVDDEDYEHLNQWKWHYHSRNYAKRTVKKTKSKIYLHRLIMKAEINQKIDHINGNGLDNRKENLRIVNQSQNGQNRDKQINNTSGYKGVTWHKQCNKWLAQINHKGKHYSLGLFETKEAAAKAYNEAALTYFGEYARINHVS